MKYSRATVGAFTAVIVGFVLSVIPARAGVTPKSCSGIPLDQIRREAAGGSASAEKRLADLYAEGRCMPQDYAEAASWYRRSAEQGNSKAQYELANYLLEGKEVARDPKAAADWFLRAADQNLHDAQYSLGSLYVNGRGVPKDLTQGYMWIRLSAPKSDRHVQDVLAGIARQMSQADVDRAEKDATDWTSRYLHKLQGETHPSLQDR